MEVLSKLIKLIASVCILCLVPNCASHRPNDLKLEMIELADYRAAAETSRDYALFLQRKYEKVEKKEDGSMTIYRFGGPVPEDALLFYKRFPEKIKLYAKKIEARPLLKVYFTSEENLYKYRTDYYSSVGTTVYDCDNPPDPDDRDPSPNYSFYGIYWKGLELTNNGLNISDQDGRFHYYTYVNIHSKYGPPFDLRDTPMNLCLFVSGGAMWIGSTFKSNVIKISKAAIAQALKRQSAGQSGSDQAE